MNKRIPWPPIFPNSSVPAPAPDKNLLAIHLDVTHTGEHAMQAVERIKHLGTLGPEYALDVTLSTSQTGGVRSWLTACMTFMHPGPTSDGGFRFQSFLLSNTSDWLYYDPKEPPPTPPTFGNWGGLGSVRLSLSPGITGPHPYLRVPSWNSPILDIKFLSKNKGRVRISMSEAGEDGFAGVGPAIHDTTIHAFYILHVGEVVKPGDSPPIH